MKHGMDGDVVVGSGLVDMFGKCGNMDSVRGVFDSMEVKDIFVWSSIIASYVRNGSPEQAFTLFICMCRQGVKPDQHVLSSVLRACAESDNLESGVQVHAQMIKNAYRADCFVGSALMSLYANSKDLCSVEKLFRRIENKDIVAWNCILLCYAQMEELATFYSISLFRELCQSNTLKPDTATIVALITVVSECFRFSSRYSNPWPDYETTPRS
ncbi:Pentatricopeptide repeat-containing protein [Forsythia ovata]|uniref:Pentatricopeptide repeat-containing protein n=1 Tax=Forsythia ovata TaxID=205694 RepID=A0ABD1UAJ7_9LAMI